jgi:HD superfamily phosphodiesterase
MSLSAESVGHDRIAQLIEVAPIGVDDFSSLRYLHAKSLIAQTADAVSDDQAYLLSKQIARAIERDLDYPGTIRVSVVRETRSVQYAV